MMEEYWGLALGAVSGIDTSQAMILAKLAVHGGDIVKIIGRAVNIASILAHHHEISCIAGEASGG